jgi:CRP-like cAMP-binding protein
MLWVVEAGLRSMAGTSWKLRSTIALNCCAPFGCSKVAREGDPHREFMVIVEGKAEVTRHGQYIATLGPGDFVGEMSLLDRTERVATVTAVEPSTLLLMTGANFDMILRDQPAFARNLLTVVSRRLRDLETRYIKPA